MIDDELHALLGFMENMALSEATGTVQGVSSKKRPRVDGILQKQNKSDQARDSANQGEFLVLREALKSEKDSLQRLYRELEAERGASMTAANEAMAMITRLQEEKAAVVVEARRHKLAAEERETYHQGAISILKEALLFKEDELLALQELLSTYKEKLMQIEIEQQQYLEDRGHSDQVRLLSNSNNPLLSTYTENSIICYGHNQIHRSGAELMRTTGNDHEDFEPSKETFGSDFRNEAKYEETAKQGWHTGGLSARKQDLESTFCEQLTFQSTVHSGDQGAESRQSDFQKQLVDDGSTSIFTRVKCLEERFEYLRQSQIAAPQQLGFPCHFSGENSFDLDLQQRAKSDSVATSKVLFATKPRYSTQFDVLDADILPDRDLGVLEESWKHSPSEKVTLGVRNEVQEHGWAASRGECKGYDLNLQQGHHEQSALFSVMSDDESEGVHDVYEVQSEVKHSCPVLKDCLEDITGHHELAIRSRDALTHGVEHLADKDIEEEGLAVPGKYVGIDACSEVAEKLSIGANPLDVKDVYANVLDDDVQQLKSRLQALEGERVFMKEAIDSLREENKELKLLQELAHQLRDLQIDVRRTEGTRQLGQPSIFNFLKDVFSFIGRQHPSSNRRNRFALHSCSLSTKRRQDGLRHILHEGSASVGTPCVKREHKVKLNLT